MQKKYCVRTGIGVVAVVVALLLSTWQQTNAQEDEKTDAPNHDSVIQWTMQSSDAGELVSPSESKQQTVALVLDVDGNDINDFVIAARRAPGPSVVWYRRSAVGWDRYLIDDDVLAIEAGGAYHDIDGDGDLDLALGGDGTDNTVWWWENPSPNFDPSTPWERRTIKTSGENKHHDMLFSDVDHDGSSELIFWNQGAKTLFLAEIPADPHSATEWPLTPIYTWSGGSQHEGLAAADIDGDGRMDIVGGGRWFKRQEDGRFIPEVIDERQRFTRVVAGQFVPGGRPEVVFVVGDGEGPLMFYRWHNGAWEGEDLLGRKVFHGHSLAAGDIDGNGTLDLFVGEMGFKGNDDAETLLLFGDGQGSFREIRAAEGYGHHESRLADLDGDGDLDILGKPYTFGSPGINIWLNDGQVVRRLDRWARHPIDDDRPGRAVFVIPADLNGDGFVDVAAGRWWYRNPGRIDGDWTRREIGAPFNQVAAVYDFDRDGNPDLLGTVRDGNDTEYGDAFVWAHNDGTGVFTILANIDRGEGDFLQGVAVGPFVDGSTSVALSWHQADRGVQVLTVPSDPTSTQWTWRRLVEVSQDEALSAGDIDRDGDIDLLLGTVWLRNDDGDWQAQTLHVTKDLPDRNRLADLDGDGDLDAVVGYEKFDGAGTLAWYEQGPDPAAPWTEHAIADLVGPMSLDIADLDGDGDADVIVGEHNKKNAGAARLLVFENRDGMATRWESYEVWTGDEHHNGAQLADFDQDGDLDIVSLGWFHDDVLIYENQGGLGHRVFLPMITRR